MNGPARPYAATVVSGLFDLGRRDPTGPDASPVDYVDYMLSLPFPLVLTVDPDLAQWATSCRAANGFADITIVHPRPLEELAAFAMLDDVADLAPPAGGRGRSAIRQLAQWARFDLVDEAIDANPFDTEHVYWIDPAIRETADEPEVFPRPTPRIAVLQVEPVFPEELDRATYYAGDDDGIPGGLVRGARQDMRWLGQAFREELAEAFAVGRRPNAHAVLGALTARHPDRFEFYFGDRSTELRNWDMVRGGVDAVLANAAHCRGHRRWREVAERCAAVRRAVDAGAVTLDERRRLRLAGEEAFAAAHVVAERRAPRSSATDAVTPMVSVIVPVWNGEATLARAVRSALDQTYTDLEVVIVDDASTDGSLAVADALASEDRRVRIVRRAENSGAPARPRDDGVAAAKGRFIALLDQDDYWFPEKLARQMPRFTDDVAVVYSKCFEDRRGAAVQWQSDLPEGDVTAALARGAGIPAVTVVIRREWIDRVGRFDKDGVFGADHCYYWLRLAMSGARFAAVDERLAVHTDRGDSLTSTRWHDVWRQYWRAFDLAARDFPERSHELVWRRPTVALCMIVRNESAVIERCIESARPMIDAWVVVDTGSTDGTPELVERALSDLPGVLHRRQWRDFGTNRTDLMQLAQGAADFLLLIDADMEVRHHFAFVSPTADAYLVRHEGALEYAVPRLVRGDRAWRFDGPTHEYLAADEPFTTASTNAITIVHHADGGSRADKFTRDRDLLEAELERDPDNSRAVFYLAQTYRDLGDRVRALDLYRRRVGMGGWDEEVFYAAYQMALLVADEHWSLGLPLLFDAWERRPSRVEPLYAIAVRARNNNQHHLAHLVTSAAMTAAKPDDSLFVERWIYDWGIRFEYSIAAAHVGDLEAALRVNDELLADPDTPQHLLADLRLNRAWCANQLARRGTPSTDAVPRRTHDPLALLGDLVDGVVCSRIGATIDLPWNQTNPSIVAVDDGFLGVVRSVNYRLIRGRYHFDGGGEIVRTVNQLVWFDHDLAVKESVALVEPHEPRRAPTRVLGLEDCRLFAWRDAWWVTATARDLDPSERCRMVLARVDGANLVDLSPMDGPDPYRHEKNWMPFVVDDELLFVYLCHPFAVLRWDAASRTLHRVAETPTPASWADFRGGSQGLPIDEGFLFVIHENLEAEDGHRRYVHRFLSMDGGFRPTGVSRPFGLLQDGVEFCAGLTRRDDELVLSFGVDDRTAAVATVPLDGVIDLIDPL